MHRSVGFAFLLVLSGCVSNDRAAAPAKEDSSASFESEIRQQINACWSIDVGLPGIEDMVVEVRAEFDSDGSVRSVEFSDPAAIASGTAAYKEFSESAKRAVLHCSPLKVPPSLPYEAWETMTLVFSAKDMIQ